MTGESLTQAILGALEERLERLEGRRTAPGLARGIESADEWPSDFLDCLGAWDEPIERPSSDLVETELAISKRCSALPDLDTRDPDEILGYDEQGGFR